MASHPRMGLSLVSIYRSPRHRLPGSFAAMRRLMNRISTQCVCCRLCITKRDALESERKFSQTFVFWYLYLDVSILMVYSAKFGTVELPTSHRLVTGSTPPSPKQTHMRKITNCRFSFSKCFDENLSLKYSRRHIWDLIVSSLDASRSERFSSSQVGNEVGHSSYIAL